MSEQCPTLREGDDNDYQVPFRFTGKLDKLTIKLVPPVRTAEEERLLKEAILLKEATQAAMNAAQ